MRFFASIFRMTHLTFRPQKRDKQVAPSGHKVILEPFSFIVFKFAGRLRAICPTLVGYVLIFLLPFKASAIKKMKICFALWSLNNSIERLSFGLLSRNKFYGCFGWL